MQKDFLYKGTPVSKVGFLGAGRSNIAVAEYIKKHHKNVSFILRSDVKISKEDIPRANLFDKIYSGSAAFYDVKEDIIFLSPSTRYDRPELVNIASRRTRLTSDADLFFSINDKDAFVITGSDGKSTTATITSLILSSSYGKSTAIGNIGTPLSSVLDSGEYSAYAVELSSFQLSSLVPRSEAALITNISKNHLDWHKDFDEYCRAKKNALINAKRRVYNYDCPISREFIHELPPYTVFSTELGYAELCEKVRAEKYYYIESGTLFCNRSPIISLDSFLKYGAHNVKNLVAAIALCDGCYDVPSLSDAISKFSPLSHRCESFLTRDGVEYINSSIDSSPKRTITTLNSLGHRVVIIVGGKSKGLDYSELIPALHKFSKAIVLTGETGKDVERLINENGAFEVPVIYESSFEKAVRAATRLTAHGDTLLLSPASTSFDSFKSFEERGETFKRLINDITSKIK